MEGGRPALSLPNGAFTVQPVLRFDVDAGTFFEQGTYPGGNPPRFMDTGRAGVPDTPINVRRARLGLQGTYLQDFTYKFIWEFAPGAGQQIQPKTNSRIYELQTAWNGLGWGTVRVGGFTLLHTLEFSTSSFESMMLEKPAIINIATSLSSGSSRLAAGIEARGTRWFAAAYATGGLISTLNDGGQRGVVGRAAGLAVDTENLRLLVGVNGAAQFHPGFSGGPQSFRLRDYPELRLEPTRLLDTGTIRSDGGHAIGPEVSGMIGPVHFTAEAQFVALEGLSGSPNRNFSGYYVGASVPLLGGQRRYDRDTATWTRPGFESLDPHSGHWGFAELAGRYSHVSLNDGTVRGGRQSIFSAALNYYPNSRIRISAQYSAGNVLLDVRNRDFQALAVRLGFAL